MYVGWLEREKYDPGGISPQRFDKFTRFMDVAFQNEEVTIYRMAEGNTALARGAP